MVTMATATGLTDATAPVAGVALLEVDGPIEQDVVFTLTRADGSTSEHRLADSAMAFNNGEYYHACNPPPPALPAAGEQPADPDAAESAIRDSWRSVHDFAGDVAQRLRYLDDDTGVADAWKALNEGEYAEAAKSSTIDIAELVFTSPTDAWFRYDVVTPITNFYDRYGQARSGLGRRVGLHPPDDLPRRCPGAGLRLHPIGRDAAATERTGRPEIQPGADRREYRRGLMTNARQVAYRCLQRIDHEGAYANLLLQSELAHSRLSERDRGFVTELVYGTTRMRRACDALIDRFLVKEPQPSLRTLLRLGAYQLHFAGVAAHAAVGETVELAPRPARGFVNAVLRRIGDTPIVWPNEAVRLSYPDWIVDRLRAELGDEARRDAGTDERTGTGVGP